MRVLENGKYRDLTEEEKAQQIEQEEEKTEPTVAELIVKIAELESKLSGVQK